MTSEQIKSPLDVFFKEEKCRRCVDYWGDSGTVIGWSKPIKLTCPYPNLKSVGGWWWVKRDRDGAVVGVHPKMIHFNKKTP
jgi:hypothetical protein